MDESTVPVRMSLYDLEIPSGSLEVLGKGAPAGPVSRGVTFNE